MLWLLTLATVVWFDTVWCMGTTFTALSMPETWVNALLVSLIFSAPIIIWRSGAGQMAAIIVLALWLEANLLYSRTYFIPIPLKSYLLAGNLGDFTASVTDSLRWADAGFAVLAGVSAWAALWLKNSVVRVYTYLQRAGFLAGYVGVTAIVSLLLIWDRGGLNEAWRSLENANYHSCRTVMYTPAGAMIHDAMNSRSGISMMDVAIVDNWLNSHAANTAMRDTFPTVKNIVVVLCESLESWVIGLETEGREVTPRLNRLVADSTTLYVPNVVTQVGAGRSIDAQLLINAGLLPPEGGVYSMGHHTNLYHTLNQALAKKRDARSYILTVDKEITWNQGAVARAFGIDTIVARDCWVNDEKVGARKKLGDRSFMRQAAEKMKSGEIWPEGENAFVQIVTYSGHNPFVLPEALDSLRLQGNYPKVVDDYMTMAHYTDGAIGGLIDYLRTRSDYDSTLIVITGDHEGLAAYRNEVAAECGFVDPGQHTPLIVVNSPVGGRLEKPIGQVDIYTTLLQLAGLSDYGWHGIGQSAVEGHPGVAIGSNHTVEGDTAAAGEAAMRWINEAPRISSLIINHDLLRGKEAREQRRREERIASERRYEYALKHVVYTIDGYPRVSIR